MEYNVSVREMPIELADRKIYGKLFAPENKSGKLPALILSHGCNSSHADVSDLAEAAAGECGILAYCYDFCGGSSYSKSSGSSLDMSVSSEISDLKEVIRFVKNLEISDGENIFLYGESQGGLVSALAADETIKNLYLLYPAFCIPDNWKDRRISDKIIFMGMHLSQKFCDGLPKYDVFEHIEKYGGNVTIFHGDNDSIVDISYAKKAAESFPNAKLEIFNGEGHGFSPEARKKLITRICDAIKGAVL